MPCIGTKLETALNVTKDEEEDIGPQLPHTFANEFQVTVRYRQLYEFDISGLGGIDNLARLN